MIIEPKVAPSAALAVIDAILIGRNEGARLVASLTALKGQLRRVIYVDSGSHDGSVAVARAMGAEVVVLDLRQPFTAARARNAGLARALASPDPAEFLQFLDGDCQIEPEWLSQAARFLQARPELGLVTGRRCEAFPEATLYNLLCDWEWETPIGPTLACGGDALIRRQALAAIGGYRDTVIAAEDDEMCHRLRAAGWGLWRLDAPMTRHDAAMQRFGQWWRRAVRAGHGFAEVGQLCPGTFQAERRRVWLWAGAVPLLAVLGLCFSLWLTLIALLLYLVSFSRMAWRFWQRGLHPQQVLGCAGLVTLSKFPNLQGMAIYHRRRLRGISPQIIEYK